MSVFLTSLSAPLLYPRIHISALLFPDIDSQLEKTKLDQVYATALAADEGLLWVGTSVGVTLVFPLPRLEGIPLVSGRKLLITFSYSLWPKAVEH